MLLSEGDQKLIHAERDDFELDIRYLFLFEIIFYILDHLFIRELFSSYRGIGVFVGLEDMFGFGKQILGKGSE